MSCPICSKRKPQRYCPAKGETICAVCCGTEREVTIDCPADCPYLIAAHHYEEEHRKPADPAGIPFPDENFRAEIIYEHENVFAGLIFTILKFARARPDLTDPEVLQALHSLAETTRTLARGVYFERPPESQLPRALYDDLAGFLGEVKERGAESSSFPTAKDSEVFYILVLLLRLGTNQTNGRPKSRAFLEFMRSRYPAAPELAREEPRIIVP